MLGGYATVVIYVFAVVSCVIGIVAKVTLMKLCSAHGDLVGFVKCHVTVDFVGGTAGGVGDVAIVVIKIIGATNTGYCMGSDDIVGVALGCAIFVAEVAGGVIAVGFS